MQNYQQTSQSCKIKKIIKRLLYFSTIAGNTILYSEINLSEHVVYEEQTTRNTKKYPGGLDPLRLGTTGTVYGVVVVCVVSLQLQQQQQQYHHCIGVCPPTCENCILGEGGGVHMSTHLWELLGVGCWNYYYYYFCCTGILYTVLNCGGHCCKN